MHYSYKCLVLMLLSVALGTACKGHVDPTSAAVKTSPEGSPCPPEGHIDDMEDNNNQTLVVDGRGGYWYTFVDDAGSTVTPTAGAQGGTFTQSPGGANGSQFAARMNGTIGTANIVYAGMGMNFVDPKGPYDASKYKGISFWARKGPGSTPSVRLKIPDINTDPDGGVCSECFNDFGADLRLTDDWQQFTIPFDAMSQMKGWGRPRKSSIRPDHLYSIQFQVNDKGQTYDIYVDDLQFTGCQ